MKVGARGIIPLLIILTIALSFRIYGIRHTLPTEERINYYFPKGLQGVSADQLYVFGMLGTAFPDDVDMIGVLSRMKPQKLDFNPHFFSYGGCLHVFMLALFLKLASFLKIFVLTPFKEFYFHHPWEFAKMLIVGRIMLVMFGLASVFMAYRIADSLYGKKTAVLSAIFLAILPVHILLSYTIIPDVPTVFWTMVVVYCCARIFQTQRLCWYVLAGAACGLAAGTKFDGAVSVIPIIAAHLISSQRDHRRLVVSFSSAALFYLAFGNPYLIVSFRESMDHFFHRTPYLVGTEFLPPTPFGFLKNIGNNILNRSAIFFIIELDKLIFLVVPALIYTAYKRSSSDILLLWGWLVPFYLVISGLQWCSPEYLLPMVPVTMIILARFITSQRRLLMWILILAVSLECVFVSLKYNSLLAQKDTKMEAAEWIKGNIPAGSLIGLTDDARDDQYCTAPPLSRAGYKIEVIGYDPVRPELLKAEYIILTGPLQMQLFPQLSANFSEVKSFVKYPYIFGIPFERGLLSDIFMQRLMQLHKRIYRNYDWVQPEIRILKRST